MSSKIIHAEGRLQHVVRIRPKFRRYGSLADRPAPYNLPHERWYRGGKIITRDTMREKCYRAERELRLTLEQQQKFENIAECARYIRSLMETAWFQRRWPYFKECTVRYKPGSRWCWASGMSHFDGVPTRGRISMSTWGMSGDKGGGELVLLHELAHCVCPEDEHHNRLWARTFVDMVAFKMSKEAAKELRESFARHNIRVNPVRQVKTSAEQRARLAACRPNRD